MNESLSAAKRLCKGILKRCGYSLHRLPTGVVTGTDLARDLGIIAGRVRGQICVDAGANDGGTINLIRSVIPEPEIHAFEPNPTIFALLQSNHRDTPRVHLVNAGLGDEERTLVLHTVPNHALNSFLPLTADGRARLDVADDAKAIEVPVHRLDDYASNCRIERIDLLKIDTQGFELHVLRGAKGLFSRGSVRSVLVELNFADLYSGQANPVEVIEFLQSHGLRLVDFYEKCRHNPLLGWCTALFAREVQR